MVSAATVWMLIGNTASTLSHDSRLYLNDGNHFGGFNTQRRYGGISVSRGVAREF